jgi:two-component system CitB family sensor kinase
VATSAPPRRVTVHLAYDDDANVIVVNVSDSGPGVSPELAERVFLDGYTTKSPRAGVQRGLGLALVHRLVSRLGGRIEVSTGPGATFTATVPVVAEDAAKDQPAVSRRTP